MRLSTLALVAALVAMPPPQHSPPDVVAFENTSTAEMQMTIEKVPTIEVSFVSVGVREVTLQLDVTPSSEIVSVRLLPNDSVSSAERPRISVNSIGKTYLKMVRNLPAPPQPTRRSSSA